jgi:hypothetical protein
VLCVLTHRRLKPGSYEEFRDAWQPNGWWPAFRNGYHLRATDDPDEVISFAFYDATPDEFEAIRDDPRWLEAEDQRLRRMAPFQVSAKLGGVYEVAEEFSGSSPTGSSG